MSRRIALSQEADCVRRAVRALNEAIWGAEVRGLVVEIRVDAFESQDGFLPAIQGDQATRESDRVIAGRRHVDVTAQVFDGSGT